MIKETYCSFEVAKLLKEKGFNEVCHKTYDTVTHDIGNFIHCGNYGLISNLISAPTHQMALSWLREVHNIYIQCFRWPAAIKTEDNGDKWKPWYFEYTLLTSIDGIDLDYKSDNFDGFTSYEEAVEEALKYALTKLELE